MKHFFRLEIKLNFLTHIFTRIFFVFSWILFMWSWIPGPHKILYHFRVLGPGSWSCAMETKSSNSWVNVLLINFCFCFYHVFGLYLGRCNFAFSDHVTLIFNIILTFYFSLFKTLSFSYKSHIIKTLFPIFDKFTILFAFEIKQLKYMKILNT